MRELKTESLANIKADLEEVQLSIESLLSIVHVCSTSFEHADAFARMTPEDVSGSFTVISNYLQIVNSTIDDALSAIYSPEEGSTNE